MSSIVIKAENLSKSYIIDHQQHEKYTALRDVMMNKTKELFKKSRSLYAKEEFWALKNVNFEVNEGDRIGIIGRNGAGKSTLLKLLSRITQPTNGRITLKGRVASLLEVGTGFHPELTGRENIFLNGAILGMSRLEIREKFDEIVSFAEIERFLDTPVKRYSSGMYVRLAFAVAAHLEPEILIVDEVLAVGDAQFQKKCLGKMEDVSKNQGHTVLFVSHNIGVITQLCNKGLLLNRGSVEFSGDISKTVDKYINSGNQQQDGLYRADERKKKLSNYFDNIYASNSKKEITDSYSFSEQITLNFDFILNDFNPNILVGIGLQDKYQNRIATFLKPVSFFSKNSDNKYHGAITLPGSIIAPNSYSFVFAIWAKDIKVYDIIESVCSIRVYDNGSKFAMFEDTDYGSVILDCYWHTNKM